MLTEWRENLAILAANMTTPADEALIVRLGDRLWQHKGQVLIQLQCKATISQSFPNAFSRWWSLQNSRLQSGKCFRSVA